MIFTINKLWKASRYRTFFNTVVFLVIIVMWLFFTRNETNKDFNYWFRIAEILSTLLSILILEEIQDIRKNYFKKAASEQHNQNLNIQNQLDFYCQYKEIEYLISDFKSSQTPLKDKDYQKINRFLLDFLKLGDELYGYEYMTCYKTEKKQLQEGKYKILGNKNKNILNAAISCIEVSIEKNNEILNKYEERIKLEDEIKEKKLGNDAVNMKDSELD